MQPNLVVAARYLIGADGSLPPHAPSDRIVDAVTIANVLRRCVHNVQEMHHLRAVTASAHRSEYVKSLSDVAVVDLAVRLAVHGRLRVLRLVGHRVLPGVPMEEPRATAPPPPAPASGSRGSSGVEVVSSFSADLDAAALVAVLLSASEDGTPFCEECARAARAA